LVRDHKLSERRAQHLARVIELEPNHSKARARWDTTASKASGARRPSISRRWESAIQRQWRYPQEIEIMEGKQKADLARQQWFGSLKRWRDWLAGDKQQALSPRSARLPTRRPSRR